MDVLFTFRHSVHDDFEIKYALRGIAKNMPWVRKVWIFGDRPQFLSEDTLIIEHVSHDYMARIGSFRLPLTNGFLMHYLSSLIPELDFEYMRFSDDFFVIGPLSIDDARKDRYIVDMKHAKRATGLWNESLWRTYDFLNRLGYPTYNFETHAPAYLTKKRVFEAYCDLKDYVTEDRFFGMLGPSAIMNHAVLHDDSVRLVQRSKEGRWIGFYGNSPPFDQLCRMAAGKTFLNCDDASLSLGVKRLLMQYFPTPCKYESPSAERNGSFELATPGIASTEGSPLPQSDFSTFVKQYGLSNEGLLLGPLVSPYSQQILEGCPGKLHVIDINHDPNDKDVKQIESKFRGRFLVHKAYSTEIASKFRDGSLDFVYFGVRRSSEKLLADISAWIRKVKAGGIIAGRDYVDCIVPLGEYKVRSTIDRWAADHGVTVQSTGESPWPSWLISVSAKADINQMWPTTASHLTQAVRPR